MLPFPGLYVIFSNKVLFVLLVLSVILLPIILFVYQESWFNYAMSQRILKLVTLSVLLYSGMSLLLQNGQFIYTGYAKFLNISGLVIMVGIVFKTMHWPDANPLLLIGLLSVSIIYAIYFLFSKKEFSLLAILKLIFAFSLIQWRWVNIFQWSYADELETGSEILFAIILILFISKNYKALIAKE